MAELEPEIDPRTTETRPDELPVSPTTQPSGRLTMVLGSLLAVALILSLLLVLAASGAT